jgi:hypothetical protein
MTKNKAKTIYGHTYEWNPAGLGFWFSKGDGKEVRVLPPSGSRIDWVVYVPETGVTENLRGEDAKERAFAIAAGFITQPN